MPEVLLKPTPNTEAAKFIADKPVVAKIAFNFLIPEVQGRAFALAGVEDLNVVQAVRDRIAELPAGADWDKVKADIADKISPWLGDGAERRAELVLRQQGFQAYQAAQFEVMDRQRAAFPYWQYQSSQDGNVRETHAALDGLVLPADSDFWLTHFPPWEWGCRCFVAPLTAEDVGDMQAADAAKPVDQRRVLDDSQIKRLENNGIVERAVGGNGVPRPINVTPAPDAPRFEPGSLKLDLNALQKRYDAPTWRKFEVAANMAKLQDGRTVWEWLSEKKAPRARRAPAPRAVRVPPAPAAPAPAPVVPPAPAPAAPPAPVPVAPAAPIVPRPAAPAPIVPKEIPASAPTPTEAVRAEIRTAVYKSEQPMGNGVNAAVKLTNGNQVIYKSRDAEYATLLRKGIKPGTQYLREVAASVLDEELKLGLVPPTALVTRAGSVGSAQLFKAGFKTAGEYRGGQAFALMAKLPERVRHDWQLFEDLVNHLDRHGGNYLLRDVGGKAELVLIDNGLAMSTVAQPKRFSGPLEGKAIDATNLARLADLIAREGEVRARLEALLERAAVDLFFARARKLLTRKTYGDTEP